MAKSYQPIGLLDTLGKLFSTLVAADLVYIAEKYNLLPTNQFGGWPGRCTCYTLSHLKDQGHMESKEGCSHPIPQYPSGIPQYGQCPPPTQHVLQVCLHSLHQAL